MSTRYHAILGLVITALIWEASVHLFQISPRYLPSLYAIYQDGASVSTDLARGLLRTAIETLLGFATGAVVGILFGILFNYVRLAERLLLPIFIVSQTIPVIAFGAIVVIWFGNSILSKVVISFYLTFFPVALSTLRGLQSCDVAKIDLMRSFGASYWTLFIKLALPTALPAIMVGLRVGISLSLAGAIVGEWFGDTVGLGVMLLQALFFEQTVRVWLLILVTGFLGAVFYGAISLVERKMVWWNTN
ncbi:ABC transporter permease [Aureimonas fodinaquatilis]|uniref:ABC transporter permease n=1 Tax=Aureimonas fodinaquatilis TaxID=2565783 RepID=A0A5B0DS57_9HYPH|nr:ABC transporter permease [Aureimonas fodinaquatilis]KAA0969637.1 ABC transporter permease [Aureimonas fodinaquatilis]